MRDSIFICYSHVDSKHQFRLRKHLEPFARDKEIRYWSDHKLKASQNWRDEIKQALEQSSISILLVSADFLASDFIYYHELPTLLKHTAVFPVLIHNCLYKEFEWLDKLQFASDPIKPLAEMSKAKREAVWSALVKAVITKQNEILKECYEAERKKTGFSPDIMCFDMPPVFIEAMLPPMISRDSVESDFYDEYERAISYEFEANKRSQHQRFTNFMAQEDETLYMYTQDLLSRPESIKTYWVYPYEHIDILDFMPVAKDLLGTFKGYNSLMYQVHELFSAHGWEGDGAVRLLWFPPFLRLEAEDSWGTLSFFVKQENNGTAFIASPVPIPNLKMESINILEPDRKGYYQTSVVNERKISSGTHKCFQINGFIAADIPPVKGESHWLLFNADRYHDLKVGDQVLIKPSRPPLPLRDFPDIQNTRNIYVKDLHILGHD